MSVSFFNIINSNNSSNICPAAINFNQDTTLWTLDSQAANMPLVTANQASGDDKKDEWTNKLVGKNIHEEESESTATVSASACDNPRS